MYRTYNHTRLVDFQMKGLVLCILWLVQVVWAFDPSLFFTGSKPRPRLEIITPENGYILDSSELEIGIAVFVL